MKILILSHSSDLAGAEKSMLDLFDYLKDKTEIDPQFIIRKPLLGLADELKKRGYKYHPLHYTNWAQRNPTQNPIEIGWNNKRNKKAISKIEKIIENIKPVVVITNTIVAPWAAIAASRQKIPHVWFVREFGSSDHGFKFTLGRGETLKQIDALSDLVIANSKTLSKHLKEFINPTKITTLYNPFDINKLEKLAAENTNTPFKFKDSLKLVLVGRIAASKGQAEAAEALGRLNNKGVNVELCLVGQPSNPGDEDLLNATIKKYDIADRVHKVGHKANPLPYVQMADVGIMASRQEAFGRTTFEYMALGRAVVGAESGATAELITSNENGFLYNGEAGLEQALLKYAADPKLIKQHGSASYKKAQEMMRSEYNAENLYERLKEIAEDYKPNDSPYNAEWLEYPHPNLTFIKKYGLWSLPKFIYTHIKLILKSAYIYFN